MSNRILVALDVPTAEEAVRLARRLARAVGGFKVGLELLMGPGSAVVGALQELGRPLLVDAKLHDIPNTVRRAAERLGRLGPRWVTVHASGGRAMMEAAREGLVIGAGHEDAGILAVTVLTSLDDAVLASIGVPKTAGQQTSRLAKLAAQAGVEGVVCSPHELGVVAEVAPELLKVAPGIRPTGGDRDDQARVMGPAEALTRGADWLVVGRAITRAADPLLAAEEIGAASD